MRSGRFSRPSGVSLPFPAMNLRTPATSPSPAAIHSARRGVTRSAIRSTLSASWYRTMACSSTDIPLGGIQFGLAPRSRYQRMQSGRRTRSYGMPSRRSSSSRWTSTPRDARKSVTRRASGVLASSSTTIAREASVERHSRSMTDGVSSSGCSSRTAASAPTS